MMHKLWAIPLMATAFIACGGSDFEAGIPLDQVPAELAKALCEVEQSCSPFFYGIAFANTDCVRGLEKQLEQSSFDQIQAAIDRKTVVYHSDRASDCIKAVRSAECAQLDNDLPEACQEAIAGTVEEGGDCTIDQECEGLSHCVISNACPGKCAARASAGVECEDDGDCALGFVCSTATGHCSKPAAQGEACEGTVATKCAAGLLCIGDDADQKLAGKCKTEGEALTAREGESCGLLNGPLCVTGLSCVVEELNLEHLTSTCRAVARAGGECGFGFPSQCPAGETCPVELTDLVKGTYKAQCQALPSVGEPCGSMMTLAPCAADLVCDKTTKPASTATPPPAPVCVKRKSLGEACSDDSLCYSLHCVDKTCVPESPCAK